jgi:phosphohistidine phosphatase
MSQKVLILIRHGVAIDGNLFNGSDFSRPLTDKGEDFLYSFFHQLWKKQVISPDIIITSPALRCLDTAKILKKEFKISKKHFIEIENLYYGDWIHWQVKEYYEGIKIFWDKSSVVLVWHNPTITDFASDIIGEKMPDMKKGSCIIIELKKWISWIEVSKGSGKFISYITELN